MTYHRLRPFGQHHSYRICRDCDCIQERGLPTDCPGGPVLYRDQMRIARGELDFRDGSWVELRPNPSEDPPLLTGETS